MHYKYQPLKLCSAALIQTTLFIMVLVSLVIISKAAPMVLLSPAPMQTAANLSRLQQWSVQLCAEFYCPCSH